MKINLRLQRTCGSNMAWLNGVYLYPGKSQSLRNHSPDGFEWGYGGSGPAQLALAILLEISDKETALKNYQNFKFDVISGIKGDMFNGEVDVTEYLKQEKS